MPIEFEYSLISTSNAPSTVLTIGDPHFRIDNLEDVSTFIARIELLLIEASPTFIVVLGDLLHNHERVHTTVMNKAYTFIDTLRKYAPTYVLVGNHDYINNSQFLSNHHWMNGLKKWNNVHIVDSGMVLHEGGNKFIMCPYVFPGRFEEALSIIDPDWKSARAIFCHQEFYGCKMGAVVSIEGDKWKADYPFCVSGHIHNKQRVGENIFYTGSSIQHAFGESQDKTIFNVHFGQSKIAFESIDLKLPRKKILYMDMDAIQTFQSPTAGDKLRITLSGTFEEFKVFKKGKKYKELVKKGVKVVYRRSMIEENNDARPSVENFYDVLRNLVKDNSSMLDLYDAIIHDKI